jgi:hypothetical protein
MNHPHHKIIASAGTQAKLDFMKSIGADVVFNYKTENPATVLAEHKPIDLYVTRLVVSYHICFYNSLYHRYWDMTAGSILDAAVANMEDYGLIIVRSPELALRGLARL